jgi:hypothetical protein
VRWRGRARPNRFKRPRIGAAAAGVSEADRSAESRSSDQQQSAAGGIPIGVRRWVATAAERRRALERQLLAGPLTPAAREKLERWLRNLEAREAWQSARLEHTVAVKQLLIEALRGGDQQEARPREAEGVARPRRRRRALAPDGED